jgi:hypothetical protein
MRIIFLDIDGPIINYRTHYVYSTKFLTGPVEDTEWKHPDPVISNLLFRICNGNPNIKLVICSSWRVNEQDCRELFGRMGIEQFLHEDWRTVLSTELAVQNIIYGGERYHEIKEWLLNHPDVTDYRIIDDEWEFPEDKILRADTNNGLPANQIKKLIDWVLLK